MVEKGIFSFWVKSYFQIFSKLFFRRRLGDQIFFSHQSFSWVEIRLHNEFGRVWLCRSWEKVMDGSVWFCGLWLWKIKSTQLCVELSWVWQYWFLPPNFIVLPCKPCQKLSNKNVSFEKVWCSYDHMSLSRDRIWHYFSMKPYTEMATATFSFSCGLRGRISPKYWFNFSSSQKHFLNIF